jgi:hypothetical protein
MNRETGCLLADVDCGKVIDPGKLAGVNGHRVDVTSRRRGGPVRPMLLQVPEGRT